MSPAKEVTLEAVGSLPETCSRSRSARRSGTSLWVGFAISVYAQDTLANRLRKVIALAGIET